MQTSRWGRVKRDWQWQGLICRDAQGAIRGTMALLFHKVHLFSTGLLYCPRGPIYDDPATFRELIEGAQAYGKTLGAYLLRLDPMVPEQDADFARLVRSMGFSVAAAEDFSLFQPRLCYVADLTGLTEETLTEHWHASTRRNLHLAQRSALTLRMGTVDDLPAFCRLMQITAHKNGFTPRSEAYFRDFLTGLGDAARLYLVCMDGEVTAAAMTVTLAKRCWYMYSCSEPTFLKERPNELLQWAMQRDALRAGCTYFDFRGVEGRPVEDNPFIGLHHYKQGFGAEFCAYIGQLDLPLRPCMKRLVEAYAHLRGA